MLANYNINALQHHIDSISNDIKKNDFLLIYSKINEDLYQAIKGSISKKSDILNILIDTNGGAPDTLKKIVDCLRNYYKEINFYILDKAMSAGTMFCMAGDNIYMSNDACLGPIDPQIILDNKFIPAQAHLLAWDNLIKKNKLSQAEIILVQKFNPAELEFCKQASDFSIQLVQEWLAKYKFKSWNKNDNEKKKRAKEIAEQLDKSKKWKLHSYPINKEELIDIGLKIEDIEESILNKFKALDHITREIIALHFIPRHLKDFHHFKQGRE